MMHEQVFGLADGYAGWQAEYALRDLVAFPVGLNKRPAAKNYLRLGATGSISLAKRFPDAPAIGLGCRRNGIVVVDVDTPDERVLADCLLQFGDTPLVVRTGSGHFHAYYRRRGEGRRIRPDPTRPVDILGDGFVIVPPSRNLGGKYEIVCGCLDDFVNLPPMKGPTSLSDASAPLDAVGQSVLAGRRNMVLFRRCLELALTSNSLEGLVEAALGSNRATMTPPLSESEVRTTAESAWKYEVCGRNWFDHRQRIAILADELDALLPQPDALALFSILKRRHWDHSTFEIANAMALEMPGGSWNRKRFAAARDYVLKEGLVAQIRPPSSYHGPGKYRFVGGRF